MKDDPDKVEPTVEEPVEEPSAEPSAEEREAAEEFARGWDEHPGVQDMYAPPGFGEEADEGAQAKAEEAEEEEPAEGVESPDGEDEGGEAAPVEGETKRAEPDPGEGATEGVESPGDDALRAEVERLRKEASDAKAEAGRLRQWWEKSRAQEAEETDSRSKAKTEEALQRIRDLDPDAAEAMGAMVEQLRGEIASQAAAAARQVTSEEERRRAADREVWADVARRLGDDGTDRFIGEINTDSFRGWLEGQPEFIRRMAATTEDASEFAWLVQSYRGASSGGEGGKKPPARGNGRESVKRQMQREGARAPRPRSGATPLADRGDGTGNGVDPEFLKGWESHKGLRDPFDTRASARR